MSKNKYEQYYQEMRDVCGLPFPEFVVFFENYDQQQARVLDLGCRQGRDALFIAREGHHVCRRRVSHKWLPMPKKRG